MPAQQNGLTLVDDARVIVTTSLHIQKQFESINGRELKVWGIGCNSDIYPRNLPDILADFSARYPDIHPVIHMETTQPHLLLLLQNGKVSVVFGINDSAPAQSPYVYKELVKSPIVCVCSPRHPLTEKRKFPEENCVQNA